MSRKIMVLTDSRAEYGILKNVLYGIRQSEKLELCIIVTGSQLSEQYGHTIDEIRNDGFQICDTIPVTSGKTGEGRIPIEMGNLMIQLSSVMIREKPAILLLLGDRYEMLAAASTAVALHVPIAHISGGECTEGAMDEQIRHAITKMAHIHFPGADIYADNIRKMGEEGWRIFNVGDPGIENIKETKLLTKADLEYELGIGIDRKTLLITYHPVTLEIARLEWQMDNLIEALFSQHGRLIITYPNSDDGSEVIIRKWEKFAEKNSSVCLIPSLGSKKYLSVMKYCGAVVGNSSSAIIEAPFLKVPVVNIGNRQKGRIMADNIICCGYNKKEIDLSIKKALSPEYQERVRRTKSLYGEGDTSKKIVEVLESIEINEALIKKKLCWDV